MKVTSCAAVDLGATSGRVVVGRWNGRTLALEEVHRFPNRFHTVGSHDYWDLGSIWNEIRSGLAAARKRFPNLAAVGVAGWGVDHALLNERGRLVFPPHAYRDGRTGPGLKRLTRTRAALERIYAATGIPNIFFNTSLQLQETLTACPAVADAADRCLLLPDYFNFLLSGRMENEISAASTTQLLGVGTEAARPAFAKLRPDKRKVGPSKANPEWSRAALDHFHIPPRWFTPPILANTRLGPVRGFAELKGAVSIAVAGHDTASAFAAIPTDPLGTDFYVSCGTWSLAGCESREPILGPDALDARVANERMGDGGFRPLTNIIGLWLLERILEDFAARPRSGRDWDALLGAAARAPAPHRLLDVADPAFGKPDSMRGAIDAQLKRRRESAPRNLAGYVRLICESLGAAHAEAMRTFQRLGNREFRRILIVGGGARNRLLCQATANAAGVPVHAYELEATALGNIGSQLIALRVIEDLGAFRTSLRGQLKGKVYEPF